MAEPKRVYWDSDCLIAWLAEEERKSLCEGTLLAAQRGVVTICISALTLTEVIKLKKGHLSLPREQERKIVEFFDNPFFEIYDVDQWIGVLARSLIWEHNLDPKDSIHVATAILNDIPELNTFDQDQHDLDNKLKLRNQPANLRICPPSITGQGELFEKRD